MGKKLILSLSVLITVGCVSFFVTPLCAEEIP